MTKLRLSPIRPGDYVPLAVFSTIYVLTCLIGALVLLVNYRPFVELWEYFSGTPVPKLIGSQLVNAVFLLTVPPVLLFLGYWIGMRIPFRATKTRDILQSRPWHPPEVPVAHLIFYALALIGVFSLARAGALGKLDSWLSYQAWIDARWSAFAVLSFFEFVNLYTFVPLAAAWCLLSTRGGSLRQEIARWLPLVIAVLLALALFQKKAALISMIIVATAYLASVARRDPSRVRRGVAWLSFVVVASYFVMVVLPTFNVAVHSEPALQRERAALLTPQPITTAGPGVVIDAPVEAPPPGPQLDARFALAAYSIIAPLMRTSAPALYYPIVFPELHAFYGPDLGLDIVCSHRIGCSGLSMPDDNLVVWDYMNPTLHGGSVAAPFQFALYSQGGLLGALVGSLTLGVLLAAAWRFTRSTYIPPIASDVSSAVVILLAINLALDSPRNSIIVSYGAFWGLVFVLFASFATLLVRRLRLPTRTPQARRTVV